MACGKGKGKEEYLYSAFLHQGTHKALMQAWITQFYLQITPCLPFLRERSPPQQLRQQNPIAAYYSFIDSERMKAELAWSVDL